MIRYEHSYRCHGRVASMDSACRCILILGHAGRCVCVHLAPVADEPTCLPDPTVEIAYLKATIADMKAELEQARSDLAEAYDQGWDDALDPPRCTVTDLDTKGNGCGECGDCTPPNPYRKGRAS